MTIAFLASDVTLPQSRNRRSDAYEHDLQVAALAGQLQRAGHDLVEIAWDDSGLETRGFDAALIGTTWDYWDRPQAFLAALQRLEAAGTRVFNPSSLVAWNMRKTYLKTLAAGGVATLPTLWLDAPGAGDITAAFDHFDTDDIVVKRQTGAGADGQIRLKRGEPVLPYHHAAMVQPFCPAILDEGEISFVMVDGSLSHALVKRAAPGDYRIQSTYGGRQAPLTPSPADLAAAKTVLDALKEVPLYARVDMIRMPNGSLALMELELIEPYLYPEQGPELGERLAEALLKRLG